MSRLPFLTEVLENHSSIRSWTGISLLVITVFLLLSRALGTRRRGSLPPGPPRYPIVGNLFDIPTDDKWKVYAQMARDLGSEIISLRLPIGPSLVILNSAACADALFVKRSAIYSDRPRMVVLQELVQAGWNLAIMPYGETFKAARKVWHKHIDVPFCRPHAVMAVNRLLKELLQCKKDHEKLVRLATGRFILSSGYGIQAENAEDPFVSLSERWIKTISHATQRGGFLVDTFPILKIVPSWFPGAGFQKKAQDMKILTEAVRTVAFKYAEQQVAEGTAIRSYASRYLESSKEEKTPEETDAVCSIIGNMYLAGADTTELTLRSFILAMALHPEIQKKGQEAVDKAFGGARMPTLSDFGTIPYVDAIINETLRWKPAVTVTIPHGALQDDVYETYFIPKDTIVIANIAAILSDEKAYGSRTDEFRPERFLMPDGSLNKSMNSNPAFGYGRRQCTGMAMSRELTWMTVASVLCSIDVGRAVSPKGTLLDPATVEYSPSGSLNYPPPFDCTFTPRSDAARHWIEDASDGVHY